MSSSHSELSGNGSFSILSAQPGGRERRLPASRQPPLTSTLGGNMIDKTYARLANTNALSEVRFVHDYVQFIFEPHTLSLYAPLRVLAEGRSLGSTDVGYYDRICSLVGQHLIAVARQENEQLEFAFSNGAKVVLSLRGEDAVGPEVAELSTPGREIMVEGYGR